MVLEKTLESHMGSKEFKPVNPKGIQSWILIGRTDAEAPMLWPLDVKSWHIGKAPGARKKWGKEKNGVTESEMVEWHHWLNGHEFEQSLGDREGQGSLVCCNTWAKNWTWLSNWTTPIILHAGIIRFLKTVWFIIFWTTFSATK